VRDYETIVITKPDVNDAYVAGLVKKVDKVATHKPGSITKKDDWGLKRLAYEIGGQKKGRYLFWSYTQVPTVVAEMDKTLRFDENVLRFLTIVSEKAAPAKAEKPAKPRKKKEE
jgi:small subunit ribosomal protein S6